MWIYIFLWNGALISWSSLAQRTVALSTTEAEFMAGTEATKEAVWIEALLEQVCHRPANCVLKGDNVHRLCRQLRLPPKHKTY